MADMNSILLSSAASAVTDIPAVVVNRARAAVVVSKGYEYLDTYNTYRPYLFVAGVLGVVASSLALVRRRKASPEAYPLYASTGAMSAALAWFARPDSLKSKPVVTPGTPPASAQALAWVDGQVTQRTTQHPGWEAATWARLANDLGQGTLNPTLQVILTRNTR